jgi:hypothetical protein
MSKPRSLQAVFHLLWKRGPFAGDKSDGEHAGPARQGGLDALGDGRAQCLDLSLERQRQWRAPVVANVESGARMSAGAYSFKPLRPRKIISAGHDRR